MSSNRHSANAKLQSAGLIGTALQRRLNRFHACYSVQMEKTADQTIRIAAALIDDGAGRLLLVRKVGTRWFMQAGGKIEDSEDALSALRRELSEEIGLSLANDEARHLGRFSASAANEANCAVEAEVFHVRTQHIPKIQSEIEEAVWVNHTDATAMPLAPLTRDCILPLYRTL